MCGIVVVVRRPSERGLPVLSALEGELSVALESLSSLASADSIDVLLGAATSVEFVDSQLKGLPGLRALLAAPTTITRIDATCLALEVELQALESRLDEPGVPTARLEDANAALVRLKDAVWAVHRDRLRNTLAVGDLAGRDAGDAAIEVMASVQVALSALDRLEVRGRDSAGLHLMLWGHGLDLSSPAIAPLDRGSARPTLRHRVGARARRCAELRLQGSR